MILDFQGELSAITQALEEETVASETAVRSRRCDDRAGCSGVSWKGA